MKLYRGTTELYDVFLRNTSYTEEEINGSFLAQLVFDTREPVNLTIRDWIEAYGNKYYIRYKEKVEKRETSLGYSYTVMMYHEMYFLHDVVFSPYDRIEFKKYTSTYTGTANDILALVIKSMRRAGYKWTAGESIETEHKTFDFKDKTCAEVVSEVISAFNTEFWVEGQTLNFGKRQFSSNGLALGQGSGFKNLTLEAVDDAPPVTRLYAYGGSTNMTGTDFLLLPGGKLYLEKNTDKYGVVEAIKQFEDIFPKGEFYVTSATDAFTFQASGINFDIAAHLIDGVTVLITFQTGALAGYDLTIQADESGRPVGWNYATKTIKVNEIAEENALKVPGDINFAVGDKFILTGLKMPQSYIDEAAERLETEAQTLLDGKCENRVQLNAVCDEIEFAGRDISIACGQLVGVKSEKLEIDREIRVTKVKRYIENNDEISYRYEITLSDFLSSSWAGRVIEEINKVPEMIAREVNPVKGFTNRTWQDVQETKQMMYDPESQFWKDITSSIVGEFGHLIVGFNSAQMDFRDLIFQPNYNNNHNRFSNTEGYLIHNTISGDGSTFTWHILAGAIALTDNSPYYIYAKCPRAGGSGTIVATRTPIKVDGEAGYYHFWVGTLNSPRTDQGVTYRSWKPVYGFTEIAGNDIVTGVIRDRLSRLIIDLVNGRIYGPVTFEPGSNGYNNITDKPNLEDWSNRIVKESIEESEISAQLYVNSARETLAKNLGYTNYSAMETAARGGKTIIDGGFLRTSLIQAEAIIAEYVTAAYIASKFVETNKLLVKDGAKIGNFNISGGWLTANANPGADAGYIDMRGTNTRIALGRDLVPATAGGAFTNTAIIRNGNLPGNATFGILGETVGLSITASGRQRSGSLEEVFGTALQLNGGMTVKGKVQSCEYVKLGRGMKWEKEYFKRQRNYVFQPPEDTNFTTFLPTAAEMNEWFGNSSSGEGSHEMFVRCNILVTRYTEPTSTLWVCLDDPNGGIFKANAGLLRETTDEGYGTSNFYMKRGCYVSLLYFNTNWYVENANFTRITP